ncbi:MAG: hypothetical protein ACI855_004510, partial [Myxococcota bacterium]
AEQQITLVKKVLAHHTFGHRFLPNHATLGCRADP